MDEKIDALDSHGRSIGQVIWKTEAHRRGVWHRCFHCWVTGLDDAGEPYLLVQRRAAGKTTWPDKLDVSVAGHLAAGEDTLDGIRELEEELGLTPTPEELIPLGTRRIEQAIPLGCDREFHDIFLLIDDTPPQKLRLQEEEVESIIRLSLPDIENLLAGETVTVPEWRKSEEDYSRIALEDFVPNEDNYLWRVAQATRRLHCGNEPGYLYGDP
ncbi:NUDIX domain-containing protein [soil metagenome]